MGEPENGCTIAELFAFCKQEIANGNGSKKIYISQDDEGNGFHKLYYSFLCEPSEIKKIMADTYSHYDDEEDNENTIALLG